VKPAKLQILPKLILRWFIIDRIRWYMAKKKVSQNYDTTSGIAKTAKSIDKKTESLINTKNKKRKQAAIPVPISPRSAANELDDIFASAKTSSKAPQVKQARGLYNDASRWKRVVTATL